MAIVSDHQNQRITKVYFSDDSTLLVIKKPQYDKRDLMTYDLDVWRCRDNAWFLWLEQTHLESKILTDKNEKESCVNPIFRFSNPLKIMNNRIFMLSDYFPIDDKISLKENQLKAKEYANNHPITQGIYVFKIDW